MSILYVIILYSLLHYSHSTSAESYFGVPVGTMKYANLGIRAEVFLADDHTIVLDKFTHKPLHSGCTALMLGPARREDLKRKVGDGILLPYTQPNFSWEEVRRYRRRAKRGINLIKKRGRGIKNRLLKYGPKATTVAFLETTESSTSEMDTSTPTLQGKSSEGDDDKVDEEPTAEPNRIVERRTNPPTVDGETYRRTTTASYTDVPTATHQRSTSSTDVPTVIYQESTTPSLSDVSTLEHQRSTTSSPNDVPKATYQGTTTPSPTDEASATKRQTTISSPTDIPTVMSSNTFPTLIMDLFLSSTAQPGTPVIVFDKAEKQRSQQEEERIRDYKFRDELNKDNPEEASQTAQWDPSFSLPPASDEQVAFLLTNGARLSDYKWIGLYDQCNKKSVPLVWLLEVDPPREEEIGPMIALERNISSGEVRILNCNTILIPSLFYAADRKQPNTFFFIGTGNVTENAQQAKARAIGYELDDPLEQHYGDDVMVRLPRGVRTFDVDFLNIYNEDVKRTYGYVILPSLLVPPCADDL